MAPVLLAPIAAVAAIAAVAGVLRLQRSSQRRLLGRVAPAGRGGTADILYFTGENCTICHVAQRPALRRLHEAITDLQVTEIDVGVDPQVARAYRVMTLPTTVVLDPGGRVSALNAGFVNETLLRNQVEAARTAVARDAVASRPRPGPAACFNRLVTTTQAERTSSALPAASDLYDVDGLLSDDERLIRDTVRAMVRERVLPIIADHFEAATFPRELVAEVASLGLLGMHLTGYGCAGSTAIAYGVACEELEAGDSGLRSFVSVQGSLAMFPIHAYGSDEQKHKFLPEMAAGSMIGCFGLTEADAGSDPGSMRTVARRSGDGWVLNGSKMWITNGSVADVAVVWATTDEGVRGFLVERGTPGFTAADIHRKLSLRASVTSELHFDNVRLPETAVLPDASGLRGPLSCLNEARYGIAWGALGAGRACFEAALDYSKTRRMFDGPIARFQLTQAKLATMATSLVQGRLVAHRLGTLKDSGRLHAVQVSLAKRANVRAAIEIAREARTILGANGVTLEYPVIRHMNNLESVLTYEGTEEVHTLILGKAITGEDAFS